MTTRVLVDVFARSETKPGQYRIDWRFDGGPSQGNTPIVLPKKSGDHDLVYTLHNEAGEALRFKEFPSDAMWVHPGSGCPSGKGNGQGHISFGNVSQPDRLTLTVNDDNKGAACTLNYMLRFDPDGYYFDPEIRNGGGGGTFSAVKVATTVAGAVAGAFVAGGLDATAMNSMTLIGALAGAVIGYFLGSVLEKGLGQAS
ncbi:MAG TPA: hypothetical protein VFR36_04465 [Sphingomicrobium sp.]|nr:hypothetical protein [Sphingomicrobium sp.]